MSIPRVFHHGPLPLVGEEWPLSPSESHHLVRVRRARPGDAIDVLNGNGGRARTQLVKMEGKTASLRTEHITLEQPIKPRVRLLIALPKGKAMDAVVQRATELAVAKIIPVITQYCEVVLEPARAASKVEKWQAMAVESVKQCGNPWLPGIEAPSSLQAALEASTASLRLVAALRPEAQPLQAILAKTEALSSVDLLIGPEGDLSASEYEAAFAAGFHPLTLARTILRVETAVVAALGPLAQGGLPIPEWPLVRPPERLNARRQGLALKRKTCRFSFFS